AVALAVLAMPLIAALFHYGRFTPEDAWMTRNAVVAYSIGLIGMILVKILAPGFYARQNITTPVKIGILTLIITQLMNLAFIGPLKHAGLALAIGLGACLNAALLYRGLRKVGIYTPQPGWPVFVLKVAASVGFMAIVLFTTMGDASWWLIAGARYSCRRCSAWWLSAWWPTARASRSSAFACATSRAEERPDGGAARRFRQARRAGRRAHRSR